MSTENETTFEAKPEAADCNIKGVSVRACITLGLVGTVCLCHIGICLAVFVDAVLRGDFSKVGTYATITEPLYSLTLMAAGFYLGNKTSKK